MINVAYYSLIASAILTSLALLGYLVLFTGHRTAAERPARKAAARPVTGDDPLAEHVTATPAKPVVVKQKANSVATVASTLTQLALLAMTVSLVARTLGVHHAPFSNQHEFACSFGWGILLAYVVFELKYKMRSLAIAALPFAMAALFYAWLATDHTPESLLPALQNHTLLTLHVIAAVLSYGAACVSSAAGILYLVRPYVRWRGLPSQEALDDMGYRGIVVSFPLLTLMLILGALWADIAWGKYWSWDPKETAALVTWLIYAVYLHARVTRGWQGRRSAILLVVGFLAIIMTFMSNYFLGGQHTYA